MLEVEGRQAESHVYAILVTYRRPNELGSTLAALGAQTRPPDGYVILDNSPGPATSQLCQEFAERGVAIVCHPMPSNLGPAGGIAKGMEMVLATAEDSDWILCLDDDDPPIDRRMLEKLLEFGHRLLHIDDRVGAVGRSGKWFDLKTGRYVRINDGQLSGPVSVDVIGGGQFPLYRVAAVRTVGFFLEELFFGHEELEFGLRLKKAGFRLYVDGGYLLEHRKRLGKLGHESPVELLTSWVGWRRYYSQRNLIYILRHSGFPLTAVRVALVRAIGKPLVSLVVRPREALRSLLLGLRATHDGFRDRMGKTVEPDAASQ
jgi:GT2 family glycosyltransferase